MSKLPFYADCVSWPSRLSTLERLIDEGRWIKRRTLLARIDLGETPEFWRPCLPGRLYGEEFYVLPGWPIYWYVHSAIEFVFSEPETIARLETSLA